MVDQKPFVAHLEPIIGLGPGSRLVLGFGPMPEPMPRGMSLDTSLSISERLP